MGSSLIPILYIDASNVLSNLIEKSNLQLELNL